MQLNIPLTIKEKLPDLPESERKIGEFILDNPLETIQMSASQLAEKAGSSAAAVIRFCHSLGMRGYTELKLLLSAQSTNIQEELHTDIQPNEELAQIKKKFLMNTNHALEKTNSSLENACVEKAAEWLVDCPMLFVYGLGASHIVAMDVDQKFTRLGKKVFCSQDQHNLAGAMAVAPKGSVYLGISNSGETREGHILVRLARQLGIQSISLTRDTDNRLSQLADIPLKTANTREAPLRSGATTSLLSQLYAVDLLFYSFMTKRYEENVSHLEKSRQAIQELAALYQEE